MDWIVPFFAGIIADVARSILAPATTDWMGRFIPGARRRKNAEHNILVLDVMEKLNSLGIDPVHAKDIDLDSKQFLNVIRSQQQAFVETSVEIIDSSFMTQAEMNEESQRRTAVAEKHMARAVIALEKSGFLDDPQLKALQETQEYWRQFAQSQAEFAAREFEGGSMAPLVYCSELEAVTLRRTGELRAMFDELRQRHSAT